MYTLKQIDNKLTTQSEYGVAIYTAKSEIEIFQMLNHLAVEGAVYLHNKTVMTTMEANTLRDFCEEIEEREFRKKLDNLLQPLKIGA